MIGLIGRLNFMDEFSAASSLHVLFGKNIAGKNITGYQLLLFLLAGDFTQFTSDAAVLVSSFQLQLVISAATVTVKWFTQQGSRLRCVSDTLPGQL